MNQKKRVNRDIGPLLLIQSSFSNIESKYKRFPNYFKNWKIFLGIRKKICYYKVCTQHKGSKNMIYIILGVFAFLLFGLYDINSIIMKKKIINCCFFAGSFLILIATSGILFTSWDRIEPDPVRISFFGFWALLFFCLLIYTLFFALPFQSTYLEDTSPKVCQSGVYALCRHPGVLWFIGFYLLLGLAFRIPLLYIAAFLFSFFNILYV
jgi:protein-S-isoprenylcysteine O-methyltransferase Ste14